MAPSLVKSFATYGVPYDTNSGGEEGALLAVRSSFVRACVIVRGGRGGGGGGGGGGGRQLVPEGGIIYQWGRAAAAPPKPMLDPGLFITHVEKFIKGPKHNLPVKKPFLNTQYN